MREAEAFCALFLFTIAKPNQRHSFRSASPNAIVSSIHPAESKMRISPERKQAILCITDCLFFVWKHRLNAAMIFKASGAALVSGAA
jgi:hypothetical protein